MGDEGSKELGKANPEGHERFGFGRNHVKELCSPLSSES